MQWWWLRKLKSANSKAREKAIEKLGRSGNPHIVDVLIPALKDINYSVGTAAANALGDLGDARAVEPLIAALNINPRPEDKVPTAIINALKKLGDSQAVPPLIAALNSLDNNVRASSAAALGHIGDFRAVEPLIYRQCSWNKDDREHALNALYMIDPKWMETDQAKASIPHLTLSLSNLHGSTKENVENTLKLIDCNWPNSDAARHLVPGLIQNLKNPRGCEHVLETLEKIDPNWAKCEEAKISAVDFILALNTSDTTFKKNTETVLKKINPDWVTSEAVDQAMPALIQELQHNDQQNKNLKALILIGRHAIFPLVLASKEGIYLIRQNARVALESIDSQWMKSDEAKNAIPELISALKDTSGDVFDYVANTLELIDPLWRNSEAASKSIATFIKSLNEENKHVRIRAIKALAEVNKATNKRHRTRKTLNRNHSQKIIQTLIPVLNDKDSEVVIASIAALKTVQEASLIEPLVKLFEHENSDIRGQSINALRTILKDVKNTLAINLLIMILMDKDIYVRSEALNTLEKIAPDWKTSTFTLSKVSDFVTALENNSCIYESAARIASGQHDITYSEPLVDALEIILRANSKQVSTAILTRIATIKDFEVSWSERVQECGENSRDFSNDYDFSQLRQLARQTLIKRGVKV